MDLEVKPLSEATNIEEFKALREAQRKAAAEPAAEKVTQSEEDTTASAAEPVTAEKPQESEPVEKSVDDQIRELRAKGKHAAANKLMAEEAARPHREEAEKLRKELEGLRTRPVEAKPEAAKPATEAAATVSDPNDPEPKITDEKYAGDDGYTKYMRDVAAYDRRQERKAEEQTRAQATLKEKADKVFESGRLAKPDFDAVVQRATLNIAVLREGLAKIPNIGDVLYKLGSEPAEVTRIMALAPMDQWAELVFVSRQITAAPAAPAAPPEKPKPAVSRVSAPPRVLSGNDIPEPKSTSEATSYEDFKKIRRARAS
jgi:hypothetical protein